MRQMSAAFRLMQSNAQRRGGAPYALTFGNRAALEATDGRGREPSSLTRRDDCGWCFTDNLL